MYIGVEGPLWPDAQPPRCDRVQVGWHQSLPGQTTARDWTYAWEDWIPRKVHQQSGIVHLHTCTCTYHTVDKTYISIHVWTTKACTCTCTYNVMYTLIYVYAMLRMCVYCYAAWVSSRWFSSVPRQSSWSAWKVQEWQFISQWSGKRIGSGRPTRCTDQWYHFHSGLTWHTTLPLTTFHPFVHYIHNVYTCMY